MENKEKSMEFLLSFSEDLQAQLFSFTIEELTLFFHVNYWLKNEQNEKIIKETLQRFFPNRLVIHQEVFLGENGESLIEDQKKQEEESEIEVPIGKEVSDDEKQKNEAANEIEQYQDQPTQDETHLQQSLYAIISRFESEEKAAIFLKSFINNLNGVKEGQEMILEIESNEEQEIVKELESLGLFQSTKNTFAVLGDLEKLLRLKELGRLELEAFQINSEINQSASLLQNSNQELDRAALTVAARQKRQQTRYDDAHSYKQESIKDQMDSYRQRMRQKQLFFSRSYNQNTMGQQQSQGFSQQNNNMMTFDKLSSQRENKFRQMNENRTSQQIVGKTITLNDISNMRISEKLKTYGKQAVKLSNEFRKSQGKPPLEWNEELTYIGMKHSQDMGNGKVPFGHEGFQQRARDIGFSQRGVYENVAYCTEGYPDIPKTIVDGWINSPGHRKNLLSNSNVCGIAVHRTPDGRWYFTQLLALKV